MGWPQVIVLLVAVQRLAELALAQGNTRRLLAEGAREEGAAHYPLFVVLHAGWLAALFLGTPADAPVNGGLLALFLALQAGRGGVVRTRVGGWPRLVVDGRRVPAGLRGPVRLGRRPHPL